MLINHATSVVPRQLDTSLHCDALDFVDRVHSNKRPLDLAKRRLLDVADVQELLLIGDLTRLLHIRGCTNPSDVLTKRLSKRCLQYLRFLAMVCEGRYIPDHPKRKVAANVIRFCQLCGENGIKC